LVLEAVVCSLDGVQYVRQKATAPPEQAAELGQRVAQMLIEGGAQDILEKVKRARG
jgi:porphobilinogen deaminase